MMDDWRADSGFPSVKTRADHLDVQHPEKHICELWNTSVYLSESPCQLMLELLLSSDPSLSLQSRVSKSAGSNKISCATLSKTVVVGNEMKQTGLTSRQKNSSCEKVGVREMSPSNANSSVGNRRKPTKLCTAGKGCVQSTS